MNRRFATLLTAGLLITVLPACNSDEKSKDSGAATVPEKPLSVEESVEISVTAKVKAVDHETRVMTLEDEAGHDVTFKVDKGVQRLHEVAVGDNVNARYKASLLAELRPATADEAAHPIAAVGVSGRTPHGATPAGGVAQAVRIVTTVEAVDIPNMRVTLRGPMGDLAVVRGRKEENMRRLHVGDTIVITMTESVAIALEKIAPR